MIPYIPPHTGVAFPPVEEALQEPNGLLCAGAELSPERLMDAYRRGIFPWYSEGEPILWWSPDPRAVIMADEIHISRSMRRVLNQHQFVIRHNTAFDEVIRACAAPRHDNDGTWILPEMIAAYCQLHAMGHVHSFECWQNEQLVGGIYGVRVGRVFCGESMFSHRPNASKAALIHVASQPEYELIDCQVPNEHLSSLGARTIPRKHFLRLLNESQGTRNV